MKAYIAPFMLSLVGAFSFARMLMRWNVVAGLEDAAWFGLGCACCVVGMRAGILKCFNWCEQENQNPKKHQR